MKRIAAEVWSLLGILYWVLETAMFLMLFLVMSLRFLVPIPWRNRKFLYEDWKKFADVSLTMWVLYQISKMHTKDPAP